MKLIRLRGTRVEGSAVLPTPKSARELVDALAAEIALLAGGLSGIDSSAPGRKERGSVARGLSTRPLRAKPPANARRASAVGIAVPGFLDADRSAIVRLSNLPFLDGFPLLRRIEDAVGIPVVLDTDTNAGAVAEARLGAGRKESRVLYLTLGTGLGAALVVSGAPVRVSRHTVGQVAHVPLDPDGPRCRCGDRGCAEATLCERGIVWRARKQGLAAVGDAEGLASLARGGHGGDPCRAAARRVWRDTGSLAGRLSLVLASLFAPEVIVFGGGISCAGDLLLPSVRRALDRRVRRRLGRSVEVRAAQGGRLAGAIGAALLARTATGG